jgi:diaminopimelate decarboxylase
MNNLIRPSLYHAHHQILPIYQNTGKTEQTDIVGPVCETSDFMAKDREMPAVKPGDYLVITGAGAYGQALSSNYNLRPIIAEYLINGNDSEIIFNGESIQSISEKYIW